MHYSKDYYLTLGVHPTAEDVVIRAAYKALAQRYHPDKNADNPKAALMMKEINEAYSVLSDPEAKRQYDAWYFNRESHSQTYQQEPEPQACTPSNEPEAPPSKPVKKSGWWLTLFIFIAFYGLGAFGALLFAFISITCQHRINIALSTLTASIACLALFIPLGKPMYEQASRFFGNEIGIFLITQPAPDCKAEPKLIFDIRNIYPKLKYSSREEIVNVYIKRFNVSQSDAERELGIDFLYKKYCMNNKLIKQSTISNN